jgi:TolB-like protein/DNA-binding winged helix-turn-helix (wHTH) protein/Tfp pilus assembly protein PilF
MFMPGATQAPTVRRFGSFEVDLRSGELRKNGIRLRISGQPFQVLAMLVERPGEVVTREEMHSKLWPSDTFVDFDHGLNNTIARIREILDDSSDTPRYVETIPRRGYRFIAPVSGSRPVAQSPVLSKFSGEYTVARSGTSAAAAPGDQRRLASRPRLALAGVAVLAVLAFSLVLFRGWHIWTPQQPAIKSLAVLPLKNLSGEPTQEYLADGMTEELIGRLAGIQHLRVISRTSVMRFKDTKLSVPEIAKTLGADAVVEGSVMRDGSRIRIQAQLIRAATDEHFWSESYDRESRDVLALQSEVAQAIAQKVEVTVTSEESKRIAAARTVSPEVYESFLKGRFALDKFNSRASVEESIAYFNEAIRKDPTFAPSYAGLARAYSDLGTVLIGGIANEERPKVVLNARKALELDPELVDAHLLLAAMETQYWHWKESEAEYRRALELSPNNATANAEFGLWLAFQGRADEGVVAARRGRTLDPLSFSASDHLAWTLFCSRRYEEAEQELRSALAVRPDDALTLWILGFVLTAERRPREAVPVLERAVSVSDRSPGIAGLLVYAYAQSGRRADALRLLAELQRRKKTGYVPTAAFVKAYLGVGDYNRAFFWLEEAYKEQSNILLFLKVHPIFDPIRNDPRFTDLSRRVGLK